MFQGHAELTGLRVAVIKRTAVFAADGARIIFFCLQDGGIHMIKTAQKQSVIHVGKMGAARGMNNMIIVISRLFINVVVESHRRSLLPC